jgi:hypothetical protein
MIDLEAIFGDAPVTSNVPSVVTITMPEPATVTIHVEQVGNELRLVCPSPEIASAIEAGRDRIEMLLAEVAAEPSVSSTTDDWVLTRDCKGRLIRERAGLEDWEAWWRRWDEDEMFALPVPDGEKSTSQNAPGCDAEGVHDALLQHNTRPVQGQLQGFSEV